LFDVGGNPGELAKDQGNFTIRADCMCNRRFCTHATWTQVEYGKNQVKDNWAFRYVIPLDKEAP
jgi:hypothetical protein